tara:strand:+ start:15347 stop:15829 length:483 start_codon:yes stop_codon:yes gene_type:complete
MKTLIVLLTAIGVVGCDGYSPPSNDVLMEIDKFHAAFNASDIDAIYASGSAAFRCSIELQDLYARLTGAKSTFGHFESSELIGGGSRWILGSSASEAVFSSTFEQGAVTERFYFVREGGKYRLDRLMLMQSHGEPKSDDGTVFTSEQSGFVVPAVKRACD